MPANADIFPSLVLCARAQGHELAESTLFDVKFWPWPVEDDEPIFAFTGGRDLIVCAIKQGPPASYDILKWWHLDESVCLNSLCWTVSAEGTPLICAAGSSPRTIFVFDIDQDEPVQTLPGHGRAINDLQISPLSPYILASASEDYSVRIWNLSPAHQNQPCRAILSGQGHKQPLLALDFHPNGRWLLTGAMDTAIALWAIPPLSELDSLPTNDVEPRVIPYPCFISQEIHTNFVDCVKWYGDSIISRAARGDGDGGDKDLKENEILIWRIDGFDAEMPHPLQPPIPYPGLYTRSAFPHSESSRGFERLLTLDSKHTSRFYLRFGLLHEPGMRPILVMGNEQAKFLFWDLQRCEEGEGVFKKPKGGRKKAAKNGVNAEGLGRLGGLKRDASVASDGASALTNNDSNMSTSATPDASLGVPGVRSATEDPMTPLQPHYSKTPATSLPNYRSYFASSQMSWSPDGKWLVGVGDQGMMVVFHRDNVR
ncbi:hypothetical protein WHR41_08854 [Cladosporium halotolerans]|uniref:WD40 repeat-like protein n=1 Tax=Cladosporium halotolerans TaxID=1052096 RepID=A0AB34KEV3_9PEZI